MRLLLRISGVLLVVSCASTAPRSRPAQSRVPSRTELRALWAQGTAAYEAKDWATCARLFTQAGAHYDAACCHAQAGQREVAFTELARAIDGRFHDRAALESDSDLALLHGDPRWARELARAEARAAAFRRTVNAELLRLHDEDQADRRKPYEQIDWKIVTPRDQARRQRVNELIAAGSAKVADDYYHAAMVFQHGQTPEEIQRAHDLAVKAVELDPDHETARWLAAAAADRRLMYDKKPQKYGTQYTKQDGKWILWEVDPLTTDAERAEWGVPPLAAARARAAQMNERH